jgi:hypothetical protein
MNRDLCIVSPGCFNFAEYLYPILDCDFSYLNEPPPDAYTVIVFGVFMSTGNPLKPFAKASRKIAVWVGTDVMQLEYYLKGHQGEHKDFNHLIDVKLADALNLAVELENLGIRMDGVVETPPRDILKPVPLPKNFTVGIYAPVKREDHYFTQTCLDIAKAMPDVRFRFYGLQREHGPITDNVYDLGHINVKQEMGDFSALIRFTKHDGVAIGPVEFMQAGRRVVGNLDIPHVRQCEPNVDEAIKLLREIEKESKPDTKASKYWRERLNHERWKQEIEKYI